LKDGAAGAACPKAIVNGTGLPKSEVDAAGSSCPNNVDGGALGGAAFFPKIECEALGCPKTGFTILPTNED
jgi:hypothetical protein